MAATQKPQRATQRTVALGDVCKALNNCKVVSIDASALESLFGGITLTSLPQVAKLFGLQTNTIGDSWRSSGMPGESGRWELLPIVKWLLERNRRNAATRSQAKGSTDREGELKIQLLELAMLKAEREESQAAGDLISKAEVTTAMKTLVASAAKQLKQIPSELEPSLPAKLAAAVVASLHRAIDRQLTALAEGFSHISSDEPNLEED